VESTKFYQEISKKISTLEYQSIEEFYMDFMDYLNAVGKINIGASRLSAINKFMRQVFDTDSDHNSSSDSICEYDNFTEPNIDCMAGLCQSVCDVLLHHSLLSKPLRKDHNSSLMRLLDSDGVFCTVYKKSSQLICLHQRCILAETLIVSLRDYIQDYFT
jgi:hypothetical protein